MASISLLLELRLPITNAKIEKAFHVYEKSRAMNPAFLLCDSLQLSNSRLIEATRAYREIEKAAKTL